MTGSGVRSVTTATGGTVTDVRRSPGGMEGAPHRVGADPRFRDKNA
jgi:hypothetical protein